MRRVLICLGIALLLCAQSPITAFPPGLFENRAARVAPSGGCSQATATIARLDGTQNAAHNTAYTTLICNLVTEGVWAKLDVMYVFATNDSANALTNLVQSSYGGTANGSPTFTTDTGYTGTDASTTIYIDTGFNPSTAGGHYQQNSAHLSMWSNSNLTSGASGGNAIGGSVAAGSSSRIFPKYSDGKAYYNINDPVSAPAAGVTNANSTGFYLANRSGSAAQQGYKNAVDQGVVSTTSAALLNYNLAVLALHTIFAAYSFGDSHQNMAITIGGSLTSTDVSNLCHELNTYLTSIAGVSGGVC